MANNEITPDSNHDSLCIPLGAAVSAKFRGAFCEAIVNKVDKKLYCRIQLDDKKTVKVKAEEIIGVISTNNKVKVNLDNCVVSGIILKIIDNSVYHVVFNDDDTGILRRNQLVLKGDRHYKLSECLDRHPLTNPEQFTKAVVNERRIRDKSDEDEFDNEEVKSCSQESMTTVSSSKTRSRQQTVASSASVGTGGSSVTVKTIDEAQKSTVNAIKSTRKSINIKYSIGSLVIVNKSMTKIGIMGSEKNDKKMQSYIGLIVPQSLCDSQSLIDVKPTQCVVKSFRDNNCYIAYKRDIDVIVKRDTLIKHKDLEPATGGYVEKCILFFDAKILPEHWDMEKLLPITADHNSVEDTGDTERGPSKKFTKLKPQSPRTSLSSLDSSSSDEDRRGNNNDNDNDGSEPSNEDDQNAKDEWVARFFGFWEDKGSPINNALEIMGADVDIYQLYELVKDYGGFQKVTSNIRWPHLYHLMKLPHATSENYLKLQMLYKRYIFPYVDMKKKLGTFEQIRNHRIVNRVVNSVKKPRPLLTARERRECQSSVRKTEACSVSSQSVCERMVDKVASGDEAFARDGDGVVEAQGTGSVMGDNSQCSSSSPKHHNHNPMTQDCKPPSTHSPQTGHYMPGTLISVAYGDDKIYKAKIINQHQPTHTAKSPSSYSRPVYQPMVSVDSLSNAGSTNSTCNEQRFDLDTTNQILYRVHYIGWNNRHDEIISSDRIIGVLSDTGQDSQSACSSTKESQQIQPLYTEQEQSLANIPISQIDDQSLVTDKCEVGLLPDISDVSHDMDSSDSTGNTNDMDTKLEPMHVSEYVEQKSSEKVAPRQMTNSSLKRRRSRSACTTEPAHIIIKRLPIVPESRIIASLNLYKTGDKMPKRPIRKQVTHKEEKHITTASCKGDSDQTVTESSGGSKRHSNTTDDSEISCKIPKIESSVTLKKDKTQSKSTRLRSPSFSNESLSDASTIPFANAEEQSLYYLSAGDDGDFDQKEQPKPVIKVANKRGRKPLHKHVEKKLTNSAIRKIREQKLETAEIESTSSQHSGSGHDKRVTRSVKTVSDQNTIDDTSMRLEEDSQTSQDGSGFPILTTSLLSDSRHSHMTPLATGTPTSSHKGRRPKQRRKNRNSQSNSSVEGNYQDNIPDSNNYSFTEHFSQPKLLDISPTVNFQARSSGRSFQRLHPSLIPNDLQKLPPEERVKLLESLIRQTHINFLDTKDKIKYVEKRISEIKTSRANGHSIESDEDKFR